MTCAFECVESSSSQALLVEAAQQKTAARKPSALIWTDPEVAPDIVIIVIESSDFLDYSQNR